MWKSENNLNIKRREESTSIFFLTGALGREYERHVEQGREERKGERGGENSAVS